MLSGNLAGMVNGIVTIPISVIRYDTWGKDDSTFLKSTQRI